MSSRIPTMQKIRFYFTEESGKPYKEYDLTFDEQANVYRAEYEYDADIDHCSPMYKDERYPDIDIHHWVDNKVPKTHQPNRIIGSMCNYQVCDETKGKLSFKSYSHPQHSPVLYECICIRPK
jgi:hypothetical protein